LSLLETLETISRFLVSHFDDHGGEKETDFSEILARRNAN